MTSVAKLRLITEKYSQMITKSSNLLAKAFGTKNMFMLTQMLETAALLISSLIFVGFACTFFVPILFWTTSMTAYQSFVKFPVYKKFLEYVISYIEISVDCIYRLWGPKIQQKKPEKYRHFIAYLKSLCAEAPPKQNEDQKKNPRGVQ